MVDQLFGSKTRVKLLQLFYGNPNRAFYVREITRKINEQINSVRRELANLLSIGIITSDTANNRLYYEVNQRFEFFEPLKAIFGARSSAGSKKAKAAARQEEPDAFQAIKALGRVDLALFTGQFTRDESAGADFLLVGDINQTNLAKFIAELEAKEDKEIRYMVLTDHEFHYRKQVKDRFLWDILAAKKQVLIDKDGLA